MPVGQLVDIICSDELNVRSEEQVFNAVMAWLKYNVADRRQHLSQVLQHVRLPLLSPKFLVGTVGSDLLVRSDEACRDLVDEAKNYLLLPQERPLMQGPRTRPRKPTRRGEVCKFPFFSENPSILIFKLIFKAFHYRKFRNFVQLPSLTIKFQPINNIHHDFIIFTGIICCWWMVFRRCDCIGRTF